ncbi:hypothetical protein AVEN_111506-1 [Araneus ventricosus]|uniref:Uncharacterized protein n=1 Tax=Araneus ventricosus TaxID=182803 RepID=A0A4Y2LA91_ARAVE|nr:hypothetical protein AVEN_111506-1 [Araneus ventricosus]
MRYNFKEVTLFYLFASVGVKIVYQESDPCGDLEEQATSTFNPTTRWQHQKSHQFHLLLHPTDGSTSTSTPSSPKFKSLKQVVDAPVVHRAPSFSVTFISQYPPPDKRNSFCLVVSILDSKPKGPRF